MAVFYYQNIKKWFLILQRQKDIVNYYDATKCKGIGRYHKVNI
jgi:hypothetical protein